jgi:hypothetical protein
MAKRQKLFLFTPAEAELLAHLESIDRRGQTTHIRDALIYYAKAHPAFDVDAFAKHLKKNVTPRLSEKDQRDAAWTLERLRTEGGEPVRERIMSFRSPVDSHKHLGRKE